MRKTEFLQELREALDGEVSASVIQSNISYYDQYISQEAAKGRREKNGECTPYCPVTRV